MKKLALASAIAAATTLSTGAHAVVSSNISAIDLDGVAVDCAPPGTSYSGFVTRLALSGMGTGAGEINLVGNACMPVVIFGGTGFAALDFNLRGEAVTGGTLFNLGGIDVYLDAGAGWVYYGTTDASNTAVNCVAAASTRAGLQWTTPTIPNTLPGLPPNLPTCTASILGMPVQLYLQGNNTR